jgi:hypothetical protein
MEVPIEKPAPRPALYSRSTRVGPFGETKVTFIAIKTLNRSGLSTSLSSLFLTKTHSARIQWWFKGTVVACFYGEADNWRGFGRAKRTRTSTASLLEWIALRHQIAVLERSETRRSCFRLWDRLFLEMVLALVAPLSRKPVHRPARDRLALAP